MQALRILAVIIAGLILLPAAVGLALPGAAAAQQQARTTIADFAGPWVGRTEPGSDRTRNATLLIERFAGDAFRITWASFEKDPQATGGVARRERSLLFRPSRVSGIWVADPSDDPFDLLGAWARIEDRSLIVESVAIDSDGRLERQTQQRTLTPDGLRLVYRRWLDQTLDREITADFLRL